MLSPTLPPARFARAIEFVRHQVGQLHQRMAPPPAAMMEMITNAWAAQAITAAADLGIADVLAKGPLSVDEVAEAVDADADTIGRLLRALSSRGIFRLRRDGRYDLTPIAETLRSDSDVSLRAFARFVGSPGTGSTGATSRTRSAPAGPSSPNCAASLASSIWPRCRSSTKFSIRP